VTSSSNPTPEDLKRRVCEEIDKQGEEIVGVATTMLGHPEPGFKEFKTAHLVAGVLDRLEIPTKTGIAITGMRGRIDGGAAGPNVVVMGELDSLIVPGHPHADPETAAAHACGHHCQIGSMLGAAFGLRASGVMDALSGSVTFAAVPAEEFIELEWRNSVRAEGRIEFLSGKPEFVRLNELEDADIAMMIHTAGDAPGFMVNSTYNGMVGKVVRYTGRTAHAGGAPHAAVNALNAAHIAMAAIHALRETFRDEDHVRMHPIITKGGNVVNAVPDDVMVETYSRGASVEAIVDAAEKQDRALRAGALAIGASVEIETTPGYLPVRQDRNLSDLFAGNAAELVGQDAVTEGGHRGASTDMGDISHIMPTIHPHVGGAVGLEHRQDYVVEDYDLAVLKAAKAMAMTVVDLLVGDAAKAKETIDRFEAPLTKAAYLALLRGFFTTETYGEVVAP